MGFFKAMVRIARGEPVFAPNQPQQHQAKGTKQIPSVYIERVQSSTHGNNFDCDCTIQNYSDVPIVLERIEMLGHSTSLNDFYLQPGQEREFRVYSGPRLTNPSAECKLHYRSVDGDYFASDHYIQFKQQADHTYIIDRITFTHLDDE